jgi:hypothetical protein
MELFDTFRRWSTLFIGFFNRGYCFIRQGNQAAALSCKWAYLAPPQHCEVETLPVVCGIDGCTQRSASLSGLDAHYEQAHRHKCATCGRVKLSLLVLCLCSQQHRFCLFF